MKLRNKHTGQTGSGRKLDDGRYIVYMSDGDITYSDEELCFLEWEDVSEEPKEYWFINSVGAATRPSDTTDWTQQDAIYHKEIGNCFETEEEAELAVRKLKALKRLKEHGFRFNNCDLYDANNIILFSMPKRAEVVDDDELYGVRDDYAEEDKKDLELLFGGGE